MKNLKNNNRILTTILTLSLFASVGFTSQANAFGFSSISSWFAKKSTTSKVLWGLGAAAVTVVLTYIIFVKKLNYNKLAPINYNNNEKLVFIKNALKIQDFDTIKCLIDCMDIKNINTIMDGYNDTILTAVCFREVCGDVRGCPLVRNEFNKLPEQTKKACSNEEYYNQIIMPVRQRCAQETAKIVQYLISKGANVNILNKYNQSPLFIACTRNNFETVKVLIENGAKITDKDFLNACQSCDIEVIKYLIEHKANINMKNEKGESLLNLVDNKPKVFKLLVESGATITQEIIEKIQNENKKFYLQEILKFDDVKGNKLQFIEDKIKSTKELENKIKGQTKENVYFGRELLLKNPKTWSIRYATLKIVDDNKGVLESNNTDSSSFEANRSSLCQKLTKEEYFSEMFDVTEKEKIKKCIKN